MASVRLLKKDIDYLVEEILSDCYLTIYFKPKKEEKIVALMQETVDFRNSLIDRVNSPIEKNNKSLVKKHYAQIRRDLLEGVDQMFEKLSVANK